MSADTLNRRIEIRLPEDEHAAVLREAAKLGHNMKSQWCRAAIKLALDAVSGAQVETGPSETQDATTREQSGPASVPSGDQTEGVRPAVQSQTPMPSGHRYPGAPGHDPDHPGECYTSDCAYGCGCWAGPSRSGGPSGVDPFGACPNNAAPSKRADAEAKPERITRPRRADVGPKPEAARKPRPKTGKGKK